MSRSSCRRLKPSSLALWVLVLFWLFFRTSSASPSSGGFPGPEGEELAKIDSLRLRYENDAVLRRTEQALRIYTLGGDSAYVLQLLLRQGQALVVSGQGLRAETTLRRALALAEAQDDSAALCAGYRWLSLAVGAQGRAAEAGQLSQELFELARAFDDIRHQGWALVGLAWRDENSGRIASAGDRYRQAIKLFDRTGDIRGSAWARNGLGTALYKFGRHDGAREAFQEAGDLARHAGDRLVECLADNNLGTLEYSLGDPGRAAELFRRASVLHQEVGNLREAVIPALNLALCQAQLGRLRTAADSLEGLLLLCRSENYRDQEGKVLNQLARVRRMQGRTRDARELDRATLRLGEALPLKNRVEALIDLAECLSRADSADAALALLADGFHLVSALPSCELRLEVEECLGRQLLEAGRSREALGLLRRGGLEAGRLGLREIQLSTMIHAARACRALGRRDSALTFFQRAVEVWQKDRALPMDPEWREQRSAAGRLLATEYADLLLEGSGGSAEAERIRAAYDLLQAFKARTLLERMLGPGRDLEEADRAPALVSLSQIQGEVLREGELLLDATLGSRVSFLFAISRHQCRVIRLPPEEVLESMVQRYRELLATAPGPGVPPDLEAVAQASFGMQQAIFPGLGESIERCQTLILVPDGCLNRLPFAEFPASRPKQATPPERDFESRKSAGAAWVRVPSATILARLRNHALGERSVAPHVLALAAPAVSEGTSLPGAVAEVRSLAWRYRHVATSLDLQSGGAINGLLQGYEVLHLAGHTRMDDQYPWHSAVRVAFAGREEEIQGGQIARQKTSVRLAVLSSCESAAGRVLSGEGVVGLSSAFLSAGADAVVASLWPVEDRCTARLMESFYRHLSRGARVAEALKRAQTEVSGRVETAHPYYWAGFVIVGASDLRLDLKKRRHQEVTILLLVILLSTVAGVIMLRRAREGRPRSSPSIFSVISRPDGRRME